MSEIPVKTISIPSGNAGVMETLRQMNRLVQRDSVDPDVVVFARGLIYDIPAGYKVLEADRLYHWVHDTVRYVNDPTGAEYLMTPKTFIDQFNSGKELSGDCDDMATLLATLLRAIGINTKFKVVKLAPDNVNYRHVYVTAFAGEQVIDYDVAQAVATPGYSMSEPTRLGQPLLAGFSLDSAKKILEGGSKLLEGISPTKKVVEKKSFPWIPVSLIAVAGIIAVVLIMKKRK